MRIRKRLRKRKKTKYKFVAYSKIHQNIEHLGDTDDPCRTTISHWDVFKDYSNKYISFDINMSAKKYVFEYSLEIIEENNEKIYRFCNKPIERKEFIILLGCETDRQ